jgi:hypothetical protein
MRSFNRPMSVASIRGLALAFRATRDEVKITVGVFYSMAKRSYGGSTEAIVASRRKTLRIRLSSPQ